VGLRRTRRRNRRAAAHHTGLAASDSALAIEVMLTLGSAFQMHLRQTQGLAGSVIDLMGLTVAIPDYTTLSRRGQKRPAISRDRCPRARFTCWSTVPA
jgi:Transposase DDE domain